MFKAIAAREPEYYLAPDCPVEGQEIEARFGGKGSRRLGLADFEEQAFLRLSQGLNPETGGKLTARLKVDRKAATDFTVTVPKELSVLIEVAGDERAKAALWKANDYAMRLVEKKAKVRVRKGGINEDRESGNISFASFYHGTTRPIVEKRDPSTAHFQRDGVEIVVSSANDNLPTPDPHAHIHNYVFNLSFDQVENQMKALKRHWFDFGGGEGIEGKFHKRLAKELRKIGYDASVEEKVEMRTRRVQKLGVKFTETRPEVVSTTLKIKGVDPAVTAVFSRRQGEIKADEAGKPYLNADGNATFKKKMAKAKAQLSQVVRQSKDDMPAITKEDLHRSWVSRLTGAQFGSLIDLVEEARESTALDRWHAGLARHASKLRGFVLTRGDESRGFEREQRDGWSR